jgi:hypothetical protein
MNEGLSQNGGGSGLRLGGLRFRGMARLEGRFLTREPAVPISIRNAPA